MIKVRFWSDAGFCGSNREDIEEFEDDATDEVIEEAAREWFFNFHSYGWSRIADRKKENDHE